MTLQKNQKVGNSVVSDFLNPHNVKEPATINGQIEKLQARGCVIDDLDYAKATLKNISYYRLAYYFSLFLEDKHHYVEGTNFTNVVRLYDFDRLLRMLLLTVLEEIEISLRTTLSNYHALKYGALGYLNASSFDINHKHPQFLGNINHIIEVNSEKEMVIHHRMKYNGEFPLWVLTELFSFGSLVYFYGDMKQTDKKAIADVYGITFRHLDSWLSCMAELRNCCAHYNRIYGNDFSLIPKSTIAFPDTMNLSNTFYDYITVMKHLYMRPENFDEVFTKRLAALVEANSDIIEKDKLK